MSKFLTPPSWYDKNGSEINIFDNTTYGANGPFNTAIGRSAIAGSEGMSYGAVAVGSQAHATGIDSIAIGSYDETGYGSFRNVEALATGSIAIGAGAKTNADSTDGIAIGRGTTSSQGGIAIGAGASAIGDDMIQLGNNNTAYTLNVGNGTGTINGVRLSASSGVIQLGNNNTAYTLNVGNGTGTSKIGALNFNEVASTDIQSNGLYLCTATKTQTASSETTTFGFSAFLWIETSKSTVVSTTDGSATFTYNKSEGQSNWAIRVSGADSDTLKCYRVFSL